MSTPGPIAKVQRSFAYRVSKWFPSDMLRWMDLVSAAVDNISGGGTSQQQERYVNKGGSDTTGNGSFDKPYLTVQKAIDSIADASRTKPYTVFVAPGIYTDPVLLKVGVYVRGAGEGGGTYNGSPVFGATQIMPHANNIVDSSFAGAVDGECGIFSCSLLGIAQADFANVLSTGAGQIILEDLQTDFAILIIGGHLDNAQNAATVKNVNLGFTGADLTLADLGESYVSGLQSSYVCHLVYNQSAAFASFHAASDINLPDNGAVSVAWTSALLANSILVLLDGHFNCNPVVTGAGAIVIAPTVSKSIAMTDQAFDIGWGVTAAPNAVGVSGAQNIVEGTPSVNRILTIHPPNSLQFTRVKIRNLATTEGQNIDLSFPVATVAAGAPTYVPAGGEVNAVYDPRINTWLVAPTVQASLAVIAGGVSAALIPADVSVRTSFSATLATFNGAAGVPYVKSADTVIGTRRGGGGFKIHAITLATGADTATDNGTYWWTAEGL